MDKVKSVRRALVAFVLALACTLASSVAEGTLVLPPELRVIGEEAFYGSTAFDRALLPEKLVEIGPRAFADSALQEINLPGSLKAIADDAFENAPLTVVMAPADSYAFQWAVEHGYLDASLPAITELGGPGTSLEAVRSYTWTASAQLGASPYQYRFEMLFGSERVYERAFSSKQTLFYTFFQPGDYTLRVQAKDARGSLSQVYSRNIRVLPTGDIITGVVRVYVDVDNRGNMRRSGSNHGHYELQINHSGGTELSFDDRVYSNPVFSYGSGPGGRGTVNVFDGDRVLRGGSRLYTFEFTTTAGQLHDFLVNKMEAIYLELDTSSNSGDQKVYYVKNTGFSRYVITTYNCFTAAARWCSWLGYDALSSIVSESSSCSDYFTFRLYDSRYTNRHLKDTEWTLVAQVR